MLAPGINLTRPKESSVLEALRAATAEAHRGLEGVSLLARVYSDPEPDVYRALLLRFYGFYAPLESRLGQLDWSGTGIDYDTRRKLRLLQSDLEAMGTSPAAARSCTKLPRIIDTASALGSLYVLEGSTLGGQVLKQRVLAKGNAPVAFFHGYGPQTALRWREFGEALAAYDSRHGQRESVIAAARETFATLHHWLESETGNDDPRQR